MIATCEDCHGAGNVAYYEADDIELCDDCYEAREQDYAERCDEARGSLWGELALDAAREMVYGGYDRGHYKAVHAGGWR